MFEFLKNKQNKDQEAVDIVSKLLEDLQLKVFKKYPVGCDVKYMGLTLRVASHVNYVKAFFNSYLFIDIVHPSINFNYINDDGVIECINFHCVNLGILID